MSKNPSKASYSTEEHTLGTSSEVYLTSSHFPLAREKVHASLAASLPFCSSSTYLHQGLSSSAENRLSNESHRSVTAISPHYMCQETLCLIAQTAFLLHKHDCCALAYPAHAELLKAACTEGVRGTPYSPSRTGTVSVQVLPMIGLIQSIHAQTQHHAIQSQRCLVREHSAPCVLSEATLSSRAAGATRNAR